MRPPGAGVRNKTEHVFPCWVRLGEMSLFLGSWCNQFCSSCGFLVPTMGIGRNLICVDAILGRYRDIRQRSLYVSIVALTAGVTAD